MKHLDAMEVGQVWGGDGHFKVVVNTNVPPDCANFVASTYEKVLLGEINMDQAGQLVFASSYSVHDIEYAFQGLDIVYWA
ncbi:MAG: hypothetical protein BGO43_07555 [Gammaproteobacteria bacterium 39-13]|nr:hypothetical protein [Gammaproteobacteria bacterium]OJV91428.1 MAG: hypothetical protein BGO43_07555 [Gammaproteobacteria bacterium 39-13]